MQVEETTLVVGIDIASEEHYARAFDWRGVEVGKVMSFSNSREGFEKLKTWMEKLKKENKKEKILRQKCRSHCHIQYVAGAVSDWFARSVAFPHT